MRQAVRQDCSFAKKQASPPALLLVVHSGRLTLDLSSATALRRDDAGGVDRKGDGGATSSQDPPRRGVDP
jgi:hypothetical protein